MPTYSIVGGNDDDLFEIDGGNIVVAAGGLAGAEGTYTLSIAAYDDLVVTVGGGTLPVNTVAPAISGNGSVGSVLTASTGTWSGSPSSYTYQWRRNGVDISGATASTYTQVVADAGKQVTCAVSGVNASGAGSPAVSNQSLCGSISRKRVVGFTGSTNSGHFTIVQVTRAPAAFDAVQLILHISQGTLPGSAVKMTVAPSAKAGYKPLDASNGNIAMTPVTWDGGNPTVTVSNAANSADGGSVENNFVSDVIPLTSLARADTPGLPPLVHARINAISYCPAAGQTTGGPDGTTEPDWVSGTYSGDQTSSVPGADPTNPGYALPITWVFYHRGVVVKTIMAAGDSTMQGSHSSTATAVDGTANRFNGFHRQVKDLLNGGGHTTSIVQQCVHGRSSQDFHEVAKAEIASLSGAGIDALMFYPFSVNDTQNSTEWGQGKARSEALIAQCVAAGITPIMVRNPPGYVSATMQADYNAWESSIISAGQAKVYDTRLPVGLSASGYPSMPDAYRLHDSGGAVITADSHPNDAFHAAVAADMYANRVTLGLAAS